MNVSIKGDTHFFQSLPQNDLQLEFVAVVKGQPLCLP